ncbi:hypothetical protein [Flavilitoribacter nigricans]|uniref:Uncharacterized protein n=1 Tax=Flavilitoribacter nigricans (strain ATCC 23147 / DSM 23189 / NBRC 102662 / NCIMB 1420 / SS-2) TaxID=1122177 RepID=A0A2D0NA03_FLAN2|nr:hypothetical protein [Flavilitoribacter nigricans]PHN05354.1 hypothetical protein CRP01_17725 [Flavilitoribacter nigricans DSM 23189 = NBRC 102662]
MEEKQLKVSFQHFLEKFPEVELPITLGEDTHHAFSQKNDPIPPLMIEQFILPLEEEESDEFTEFIACFRMPAQKEYQAIVYWKAGLLNYQYMLATFGKDEKLIDKRVIGGTYYDGEQLTQSVATIKEDGQVIIASGQGDPHQEHFEAASTTAYRVQIGTKGKIVNL